MRMIKGKNQEGFSLVEMIIAIAIVGLVMSGVVLLISYSTSSMRRTSNTVNLQNQAKDAVMHMTTYMQEASDVSWDATNKALITVKKKTDGFGAISSMEVGYYWVRPKNTTGIDGSLLFVKDVVDFDVKFVKRSSITSATEEPTSSPEASPEATAEVSPSGDVEAQYIVCFYKKVINNPGVYLNDDGSIKFDALSLDYATFNAPPEGTEGPAATPETTIEPVATPEATVDPGLPVASTAPAPAPVVRRVGGNSAVITLRLRNDNGDADFTCVKEVFFRNQ